MSFKKPKKGGDHINKSSQEKKKNKPDARDLVAEVTAKYTDLHNLQNRNAPFADYPLSEKTLKGLDECGYVTPTEIQKDSLPFSLTGHDIVAAAKTGSGKTLAMIIPALECLWRNHWNVDYGLGCLIISPTRELALQTFTCLNDIGKEHQFSCALLIGGTDVKFEKTRIGAVNIIVCTPGRLLQHMDENEQLNCNELVLLAIDEADRMLDMGFSTQINSIMDNLPRSRQTLLFSATQTNNIKDLSRACTKDPYFINPHQHSAFATPEGLNQFYMIIPEHQKINMLWSFIVNHKRNKSLIFVTSCKQARFLTEAFCHMRPGVIVMGLWGTMNQTKRVEVFQKFENKEKVVLIATDVASRGLDFSDVDWVVQVDAPATIEDYIHRVGRTARMDGTGNSILFLNEFQEESMKKLLEKYKIPIVQQKVSEKRMVDARPLLRNVLIQFAELKEYAQGSVVSYIKSVYLMKNKKVFDVDSINVEALAEAYGLASAPKIRFLRKQKQAQKTPKEVVKKPEKESPLSKMKFDIDEDEDFFSVKTKNVFNVQEPEKIEEEEARPVGRQPKAPKVLKKVELAKKVLRKGIVANTRVVFDADGNAEQDEEEEKDDSHPAGLDLAKAQEEIALRNEKDKKTAQELRKRKKTEKKLKALKKKKKEEDDFAEEGEESDDNSVDLNWLPNPDEPTGDTEDVEEPKVKRRNRKLMETQENFALDLLNPF